MLDRRTTQGFTHIEMMIVVAVVAILTAVALPTYRGYAQKSRRSEAQSYLLTIATRQQQFLVDTRAFSALTPDDIASQPANVKATYDVRLVTSNDPPPPTFKVTATPKPDQAAEQCGELTVDQTGAKTAAVAGCW